MCGICGAVRFASQAPADVGTVRAMTAALAHRGPDGEQVVDGSWFALGFRRLSVIDVSPAAMQPFASHDGGALSLCNGEIYNHRWLRRTLAARGYRFRSACDAEVVVHAYSCYGDAFVDHIEGMFAIAIVDVQRRRLVLARDRVGIKPLYFAHTAGGVSFASELDALMLDPAIAPTLDPLALNLYFVHGSVPSPHTIYRGVSKLDPGEITTFELDRGPAPPSRRRYWRVRFSPDRERPFHSFRQELDGLVTAAVSDHLESDVELGAFLSGGIDSSAVVGKAALATRSPLRTITIGFRDSGDGDEREAAREVAKRWGLITCERTVGLEGIGAMREVARTWGEPFGDTSAIPMLAAAELAREQGLKVMLSGDGGDELFSGYLNAKRVRRLRAPWWSMLGQPRALARALRERVRAGSTQRSTPVPSWLAPALANVPIAAAYGTGVLRREVRVPFEQLVEAHAPLRAFVADLDLVDAHFTACFQQYLQDDILTKVDRATSRYGLEARVPLLDRRVVELAARIPVAMKITPARTKHIFVEAMAEVLPPSVLSHPKRGFGLPSPMLREPLWRRDLEAMLASVPAARALVDSTHAASWPPMTVWRALSLVYWLDEHPRVHGT